MFTDLPSIRGLVANLTTDTLREIAGAPINRKVAESIIKNLPEVTDKFEINTQLRLAHFLGQLGHESDHFRTYEEYASGAAYEGRRDLGNVIRGDGRRYKGRGPIQVTGRANYKRYGDKLGFNLVDNPELAEDPRIGLLIAGQFWHDNGLNALADQDNGKFITRRINGGYNGLNDRLAMVERAKKAFETIDSEFRRGLRSPAITVTANTPEPEMVKLIPQPVPEILTIDLEDNNG